MKKKTTVFLIALIFVLQSQANEINNEICEAFATEHSGDYDLGGEKVHYLYDDVYNYCVDFIEPELKNDNQGKYYEFELIVCGNTGQRETLAYTPSLKVLDSLAGSGSYNNDDCPYYFK